MSLILQYIKKIIHHDWVAFIPGIQRFFNIHKSISVIHYINKLKNKNCMIILTDAEKLLTKFSTYLWLKKLSRMWAYLNIIKAAAAAKLLQSCLTLCNPIDSSPPGSPIPGILQARTLEWDAISFSNVWKWKVKVKSLSRVQLFTRPWTAAYQAPPPMGFSRQEYCLLCRSYSNLC